MKMKKALLLFLALLPIQHVSAKVVTESQARQRAADFFVAAEVRTKASATRPDDFRLVGTFPETATRASSAAVPAMYIFERPAGGYAIVSGDDVARPVLGYSLGGRFPVTDMPENLRGMLQWYADIIAYAREQHWASSQSAVTDGLDPANAVQLHTAQWGQGSPFNDLVPIVSGKKPPIGCVATAISIIMRYHKWPRRGVGNLPSYGYTYNGDRIHIDGFSLGHEYDWNKMPENAQHCSAEEAAQIARLLYDVAVMCKMEFEPGGSGASANSALLLTKHFDYDRQIVEVERGRIDSDARWERLITEEINAGRPVLYTGGHREGHAFVIDGCNGCYFSINYGWNGSTTYNEGHNTSPDVINYYTLRPIEGHEEDLLVYYKYQTMILRIMPDQGGTADPFLALGVMSDPRIPYDFERDKSFGLMSSIYNNSVIPFSRDFRYILFNRDGVFKEFVSSEFRVELEAEYGISSWISARITKELEDGDQLLLCMKDPDSGEWTPILQSRTNKIVFSTRPLSELVSLEYIEEPRYPDTTSPEKKRDLSLTTYKDCPWVIYGENGIKYLDNNRWINAESSDESVSYRSIMSDPQDIDCDRVQCEIWLPAGSYSLHVHNPATGEKMIINLEL